MTAAGVSTAGVATAGVSTAGMSTAGVSTAIAGVAGVATTIATVTFLSLVVLSDLDALLEGFEFDSYDPLMGHTVDGSGGAVVG